MDNQMPKEKEMKNKSLKMRLRFSVLAILCVLVLVAPASVLADPPSPPNRGGPWWDVEPEEENPSSQYDSILYSEIGPKLREIEVNSNRVRVEVIGQSAGGRDLYLVTLSAPEAMGRLGQYQAIRQTMLKDPEKAQEMIDKFGDFKVPVFINGSIHGGEYPGVDAAIRLIEKLAYDDSEEVQAILDNVILLVNVVQNPDGRVAGTRSNANGIDINRDFYTQSQPESRATVRVFTEWNPMVVLDLHGFVNPMLIEPCTPPHNPNYEYDLYINWALAEAEAMEAELLAQTGRAAQIPYRDFGLGWDDWPPSYTPMYAMYHGAYGHTLETCCRDESGVDGHYAAVWGALKFVAQNREAMVRDQVEIFRRGYLDLLQQPIPPELLPDYPQYQDLMIQDFPAAYVIPADQPFQVSPHQPARLVDFLLFNDIQVDQASQSFNLNGVEYPKGTYIVWLDQPKRGLANVILDAGLDLSDIPGLYFYSPPSVWSHPFLWGVNRAVMQDKMAIKTNPVNNADRPQGSAEGGKARNYAYLPTSIAAVQATNDLLARGDTLYRAEEPFNDSGRDFGPGAIIVAGNPALANELANGYALDVFALDGKPDGAVPMREQRIVAYVDSGGLVLLDRFGFDYDTVSRGDLNSGVDLTGYDVFINNSVYLGRLNDTGKAVLAAFFAAGGDYIGLGDYGALLASEAGLLDFDFDYPPGNSIVHVDYNADDSVAAGFGEEGYAFVNYAAVFSDLGEGVEVTASIQDRPDFLVSGFWPGWQDSGVNGAPIVIRGEQGSSDVTLIGFDPTFRAHPEDSFRMVANAIYSGLD
jgi:hypothetical protein